MDDVGLVLMRAAFTEISDRGTQRINDNQELNREKVAVRREEKVDYAHRRQQLTKQHKGPKAHGTSLRGSDKWGHLVD